MDLFTVSIFALAVAGYIAPSLVAVARRHKAMWWIVGLNILVGWTIAGWIVLIVWSYMGRQHHESRGWA